MKKNKYIYIILGIKQSEFLFSYFLGIFKGE